MLASSQVWGGRLCRTPYLLSSSKSVVEAGHVGHDSSLIRLGGVDNVWGGEEDKKKEEKGDEERGRRERERGREKKLQREEDQGSFLEENESMAMETLRRTFSCR